MAYPSQIPTCPFRLYFFRFLKSTYTRADKAYLIRLRDITVLLLNKLKYK
mgnify:CR=1 FL=1